MGAGSPFGPQPVQVQVDWSAAETLPIIGANLFYVHQSTQEFVITFGAGTTPYFATPPSVEQLKTVKIKAQPIVRMSLAPGRVVELLQLLQQHITAYQQAQAH